MRQTAPRRQGGASLVTAVFLITALAALAAAMTRMMVHTSIETANEYLSAQALYGAESGIDWAVYDILRAGGTGQTTDSPLGTGAVWFTTTVRSWTIDTGSANQQTYYEITSTGEAGGTAGAPTVQRQLTAYFMP